MFAKIWKKLGIIILILACLFNITNKLVHKISLTKELEALKQLVSSVTGANPDTTLNTTTNEATNETTKMQNTNQLLTNTVNTTDETNTADAPSQIQQVNQVNESSSSLTDDIKNIISSNTQVTNETTSEENNSQTITNSQDAVVVQIEGTSSDEIDNTVYGNN